MLLTRRNKRELWLGSTARDGFPVLLSVAACLPFFNKERTCRVMLYTVTVLELASGRVDRGVKTDPPNLFTNISRGSDILGREVEVEPP